jgi:hypothetical protein
MFKAVVPEAAAVAGALGNLDARAAFETKWTPRIATILSQIAVEIKEIFDARA